MKSDNELKELEKVQNVGKYDEAEKRIKAYVENKYQVKVYKCRFSLNDQNDIKMIFIYLTTTEELHRISIDVKSNMWLHHPEDVVEICNILKDLDLIFLPIGYGVLYRSFETVAMETCYSIARKEKYGTIIDKCFNPKTMEVIHYPMFVVYKTKENMITAEQSGELKRIKEEFYNFIKKYDKYDYITYEKHLLVHFDYSGHARSSREYSDLYWDMLR